MMLVRPWRMLQRVRQDPKQCQTYAVQILQRSSLHSHVICNTDLLPIWVTFEVLGVARLDN